MLARDGGGRPVEDDASFQHADDTACDAHGAGEILLDEHDGRSRGEQCLQLGVDAIDDQRRKPERDLVQEKNIGIAHQRPADGGRLLLPARKMPCLGVTTGFQVRKGVEDAVDAPLALAAGGLSEKQVFLHRHLRKQAPAFRHQGDALGDPLVRRDGGQIFVVEKDAAGGWQMGAGDRSEQRRLAGAICADQRQHLALGKIETDPAHRLEQAVADV